MGLRKDTLSQSVYGISLVTTTVPKVDMWPPLAQSDQGLYFMIGRRGSSIPLVGNQEAYAALLTVGSHFVIMRGTNLRMLWTVKQKEPRFLVMFNHGIHCSGASPLFELTVKWDELSYCLNQFGLRFLLPAAKSILTDLWVQKSRKEFQDLGRSTWPEVIERTSKVRTKKCDWTATKRWLVTLGRAVSVGWGRKESRISVSLSELEWGKQK